MARLIWTEPALQDLEAIADYIGLDKPRAAAKFVRRVFAKVELLRRFPHIGSIPSEIADLPYRQLIVPPCRMPCPSTHKPVITKTPSITISS